MLNEYGFHLAKHLAAKREVSELQLFVESLPMGSVYKEQDKKQVFIPSWRHNKLLNSLHLLKHIKKHQPQIVIINLHVLLFGSNLISSSLGLILPFLLKMNGFKTIVLLHDPPDQDWVVTTDSHIRQKNFSLYKWLNSQLTKAILYADLVGVTGEHSTDFLRDKFKKNNIALLPYGTYELPGELDFKLPAGPFKILTFGRFGYHKRLENLIEAFEGLKKRTQMDIRLVIAGDDHPNRPGYLNMVKEQFTHVQSIQYTGYVPESDIAKYFKDADLVVFPYIMEPGASGVLYKAGSFGKAAVLPDLPQIVKAIKSEGYQAEYYRTNNTESLALTLEKLINNPKYRNELERANFKTASSLSMEDIVDWYLIHIEKLTAA